MGIISAIKGLVGFKRKGRIFTDEDRDASTTTRNFNAERKKLEWEAEKLELQAKVDELKAENTPPVEDLSDTIREIVEDVLEEQGGNDELTKYLPLLAILQGKTAAPIPQLSQPQGQAPPPSAPTPTPIEITDGQLDMLVAALPEQLLEEIENIPKENYLAISGALWERLNKSKP